MGKSPYKIPRGAGFVEAANEALRRQTAELLRNVDGTIDGDVEALHDMRVASRRLRAAMSVFGPAYAAKRFTPLEKRVAAVTDGLGSVRDLDVLIEHLEKAEEGLAEAERVGVRALVHSIHEKRHAEREILVRDLGRLKRSSFKEEMEELIGGPIELAEDDDG